MKKKELLSLVKDKKVFLACHWDADGVSSGAMLYHLIKDHCKITGLVSKGDTFEINMEDIKGNPDLVICADIQPGKDLDPKKVIYIDHHPLKNKDIFRYVLHDESIQSCSLLIWEEMFKESDDPYIIFLTLIGYFGDSGKRNSIPPELHIKAMKLMPELMEKRNSFNGYFYEIERYVSLFNTGKRIEWSGDVPLRLLIEIEHYNPIIYGTHPLAQQLFVYRNELKKLYQMEINIMDQGQFHYSIINCPANIQGVLCARYMKNKPIICMNNVNGNIIGSMRVPDHVDFDAGKFLSQLNGRFKSYIGGGHEKAGGFSVSSEEFKEVFDVLLNSKDGSLIEQKEQISQQTMSNSKTNNY